jgi:hypothetical protein
MSSRWILTLITAFLVCSLSRASSAQTDVTAPGDTILLVNGVNDDDGDSGPPPAGEVVEHAIDNVRQKYLNFLDLGSGFIVTPTLGAGVGGTIVTGARFYTANDAVERDPASYVIEGSISGAAGPWVPISAGPLALPAGRNSTDAPFSGTTPVNPATDFQQTITFPNLIPYTSYRVVFPTLKDAPVENSMQIAEVELHGTLVPEPGSMALVSMGALALLRRRR